MVGFGPLGRPPHEIEETVTVYKVKLYDAANDEVRVSRRMATPEGAAIMRGEIIEDSGIEISSSQLEPGEQWTPRGFEPA